MLPTLVFANNYSEGLGLVNIGYLSNPIETETIACPSDIFRVQSTSGSAYDGYIFRLVDDAVVLFDENDGIQVLLLISC